MSETILNDGIVHLWLIFSSLCKGMPTPTQLENKEKGKTHTGFRSFREDVCHDGLGNGANKLDPSGIFKHGILREKQAALKELDPFTILLKSVCESQAALFFFLIIIY